MSNLQFIALITSSASSFVLVILAWMYSNARLSRLEAMLDNSNAKHESGIAGVRLNLDSGLASVRTNHDAHMAEIRNRLASIDNHLMTFYTVTGKLEGRIDELSRG